MPCLCCHVPELSISAEGPSAPRVLENILDMLQVQEGLCFYSGAPLEYLHPQSHWRWFIERLDNHQGYSRKSCVLVAVEFNTSDFSRNKAVYEVTGTARRSRAKVAHIWGPWPAEP